MIIIYRPTTKVKLSDNIPGVIQRVAIGVSCKPCYEISWWNDREKKESWFWEFEFEPADCYDVTKIGFHDTKD
jgi:hypothetical protein